MKKTLVFLSFMIIAVSLMGQKRFILQNGSASVWENLDDAVSNAVTGDTLYLPGGVFTLTNNTIDKGLVWIGAGYHPDSTMATGNTQITSTLTFNGSADNTYLTGIEFTNQVFFGEATDDALNVTIERCKFNNQLHLRQMDSDTTDTGMEIRECVLLSYLNGYNIRNLIIENSMLFYRIYNVHYTAYLNCDILYSSTYNYKVFYGAHECFFANCVFPGNNMHNFEDMTNCTFSHCLFNRNMSFPVGTNAEVNCVDDVNISNIYTYLEGGTIAWDVLNDFHLVGGSPGENAGSDGTDTGIYGGSNPLKEGGLPFNPHIRSVSVPSQSTDGNLPVEIGAGSQTH